VVEISLIDCLPAGGIMALLAITSEFAFMDILMAIQAGGELEAREFHIIFVISKFIIDNQGMAFFALHLFMFPGKREFSFAGVIESHRRFECIVIMASEAIVA
jgi:hypothetical protein